MSTPNDLRTTHKPNARMCGWDCEPVLRRLQMVRIPFATNRNLSVVCANTKGTGCAGCPFHAPGVLSMRRVSFPCAGCPFHAPGILCLPQVCVKLINHAPNTHHMRTAQHVCSALVYTRFKDVDLGLCQDGSGTNKSGEAEPDRTSDKEAGLLNNPL